MNLSKQDNKFLQQYEKMKYGNMKEMFVEEIRQEVIEQVVKIMMDDTALKHTDVAQTSFARLMCQEFSYLKNRVDKLDPARIQPKIETSIQKKIESLEKKIEQLTQKPEELLRLCVQNFKLE